MGVPKHSRKGKKAWRKNIDATEIETFLEDETLKERREPAVQTLKDEDLFVLDKAADDSTVPAAIRKRRRDPKPLKSQLILDSLRDGITPVPAGARKKQKGPAKPLTAAVLPAAAAAAGSGKKRHRRQKPGVNLTDIWSDGNSAQHELDWTTTASGEDLLRLGKRKQQQQQQQQQAAAEQKAPKKRRAAAPTPIPAVEIDMPGCSFNPEPEAHQDALAVAVAKEYKKQLKQEMAPTAPAQHAPEGWKPADELKELLGDVHDDDEEEAGDGEQQQQQQQLPAAAVVDENAIAIDSDAEDDAQQSKAGKAGSSPAAAAAAVERKTKKDRNKEARRKQQEAEAAVKQELKKQRQQLDTLPTVQQQLEQDEQEKQAVLLRRQVVQQEKAASQPPRLGKEKFEAPAPAVLTSDELTGSLRQLRPCFLVTADRFKALQKRGLIEPRKPAKQKQGKKVEYVTGERREKAEERQQEIVEMRAARKKAVKVVANGVRVAGKGSKGGAKFAGKAAIDPAMIMPLEVGEGW